MLGANGAGKSTLLSVISGLIRPDDGPRHAGRPGAGRHGRGRLGAAAPPPRSSLLAQQALLFPHLTAAANVAFGPRSQGRSESRSRPRPRRAGWPRSTPRTSPSAGPTELSGGQAQRIAIARALAAEPALLLLDEPMSALDVAVAPALRQLLRRVLRDHGSRPSRTALIVTHDLIDALSLADRVVVLEAGRVVEDGRARTVLSAPRSAFAARIAGVNLISGTRRGARADHLGRAR